MYVCVEGRKDETHGLNVNDERDLMELKILLAPWLTATMNCSRSFWIWSFFCVCEEVLA